MPTLNIRTKTKGLPKTRSGCWTCKKRRVKCGEEKPACLRCKNFGVSCDGYGTKHQLSSSKTQAILLPRTKYISLASQNPTMPLFSCEQDHHYFEIFCNKTAFEILPLIDSETLRQMMLQACISEPAIRHAVVALGALDMTAESLQDTGMLSLDTLTRRPHQHHRNALKQYSAAVKHMRIAAASGKQEIRTAILASLIIICFEAWNGNQELAVCQIQTGVRLLTALREEAAGKREALGLSALRNKVTEDALVRMYGRLDVAATTFTAGLEPGRNEAIYREDMAILNWIPPAFSSCRDAQTYETALLGRLRHFMSVDLGLPEVSGPRLIFPMNGWWGGSKNPKAAAVEASIVGDVMRWSSAFEPLQERLRVENDEKELLIASMLNLHVKAAWMALTMICIQDELDLDAYFPVFTELVDLAEYSLSNMSAGYSSRAPRYQFDSHVIIPLTITAYKCRDPVIRRRAISLLVAYPRREGLFDSVVGGNMAKWWMTIEEEFMEGGVVPGWARIHGVTFEKDRRTGRSAILTCEQRIGPDSEECVTRRKIITW